jgi:membrane associated rhomboid family serine protease
MLIFPYSTALTLGRPPYVSYAAVVLCLVIYSLQLGTSITESLMYYPDSWNPVSMISASLALGGFWHLFGNLVFFMAFAPAL